MFIDEVFFYRIEERFDDFATASILGLFVY